MISDQTRRRISEAAKRRGPRVWSDEQRAKLGATNRRIGKKPPPCSQKGRKRSSETIERLKAARARDTWADQYGGRSAFSKKLWEDQAYRTKCLAFAKDHPTDIERKLMDLLNAAEVEYVFQYPVEGTRYVTDFYLPRTNTLVEADGERWHAMRRRQDAQRDEELRALGFKTVRLGGRQIQIAQKFNVLDEELVLGGTDRA